MTLSFLRGLVAAVNPCGFVLLPTYLMFFLGADTSEVSAGLGVRRASIRRALVVSSALTAGFMSVFIVVGLVTYNFTSWIQQNARYATIVIAVGLVVLGIAMLTGRGVGLALPRLDVGGRDRGVRSMFLFGVAYAVASLGCTIGLFLPTLIAVRSNGVFGALGNVAAYAAGMGLLITALTVSLAVAKIGLLGVLRRGMHRVETIAGVFVVLSGLYLAYYFWVVDVNGESDPITVAVEQFQRRVITSLNNNWQNVAVVLGAIVIASATYARLGRDSETVGENDV
ncbi:MAG: cytochrome c biogenesis CcdA family protein [Actinobacteria bacterium]|nr:cytochrome c biogenesis CcdA family protein [Actinomycetota bacterium]MDA2994786.1 cytochrome c biogenesis CcdA family protein [Actinomycetota bacterium]